MSANSRIDEYLKNKTTYINIQEINQSYSSYNQHTYYMYVYYMHIKDYLTHSKNIKLKGISYERPENPIEDRQENLQ